MKNIEIIYIKQFLLFSTLWGFYLWSAFYLSDNNSSLLALWGIINWSIFLVIPFLNHKYLIHKQKKIINTVNWFLAILYLAYLYPIFNGFIGDKIIIQPAYLISAYCLILALKNILTTPKEDNKASHFQNSGTTFENERKTNVIDKQLADK